MAWKGNGALDISMSRKDSGKVKELGGGSDSRSYADILCKVKDSVRAWGYATVSEDGRQ